MPSIHMVIDDAVPFAQEIFSHLGTITLKAGREIERDDLMHADALIIRSRTQITRELIQGTPVKFVGSTVVGLDHVDQPMLEELGIQFYSAQGCNANSVAEFVLKAMLEMAEKHGFELAHQTLGVIGVGNVGTRLVDKAQKIGMNVLINDPPRADLEPHHSNDQGTLPFSALETCLNADIISVHTPLTKEGSYPSVNLIHDHNIIQIGQEQILINAARGDIINETAWKKQKQRAKIIDCWSHEPNIDLELLAQADIATPHIAGHTFEAKINGSRMVYEQLCQYLGIEADYQWQSNCPQPNRVIDLTEFEQQGLNQQSLLTKALRQTHNIYEDMHPICTESFNNSHKNFEYYRRNYPIHHEFHMHKIYKTSSKKLNKTLSSLGFNLT